MPMKQVISRQRRQMIFWWVILGCIAVAAGYTLWGFQRDTVRAARMQTDPRGTLLPADQAKEFEALRNQPHILFINAEEPYIGKVKLMGLDPQSPRSVQTGLACGRLYYAAGHGICLTNGTSTMGSYVRATLLGADLKPWNELKVDGILSRARVSSDGKYAAFTVFVSGHSYEDVNLSTATILLDTATGLSLGNLEEFETWKDGRLFQVPDFNFWGVTFAQDSNRFYATLKSGDKTYLVQGDIAARKLTVLHENVECPSLSPDGTRIAYKKLAPSGKWQLTVLDLATMKETPLAEKDPVDDQVEWLDPQRILYQKADFDPPKWVSVFVVPADGSGKPEIFIQNATSPVVVR
jgi:hypothetical protein